MAQSPWNRLIKIGASQHLTDSGLAGGTKLINSVTGLDQLRASKVPFIRKAITGIPRSFNRDNLGAGVEIAISAEKIPVDLFDDVLDIIDTAMASNSEITIVFSDGPEGTLSVDVKCGAENKLPVEYPGDFIRTTLVNAVFNFTVVEIN